MTRKKRSLRRTIFIACEGRNTEPIYFEKIAEEIEDRGTFSVTIYPERGDDTHVSHALGLVLEARSRIDDFDEVWVVFDRNGYTKHKEAFELAADPVNGKRVHIAFSSIAFEMWVLLHFEKSDTAFAKSAGIVQLLRDKEYFPSYEKKAYLDTYSFLRDRTLLAMENAAWLRHELARAGMLDGRPLYELNPYTDVDMLVLSLLEVREKYMWGIPGELVSAGGAGVKVEKMEDGLSLRVTVANGGGGSLLFNAANIGEQFSIRSGEGVIAVSIDKTAHVAPGERVAFVLTPAEAPGEGAVLVWLFESYRVMIGL
ncbi:MAG: RloB domain-containing protein [Chitinophagaceae bacterium]|nr:RloB domain-containing protein [Chitinophagaceae bacterium]